MWFIDWLFAPHVVTFLLVMLGGYLVEMIAGSTAWKHPGTLKWITDRIGHYTPHLVYCGSLTWASFLILRSVVRGSLFRGVIEGSPEESTSTSTEIETFLGFRLFPTWSIILVVFVCFNIFQKYVDRDYKRELARQDREARTRRARFAADVGAYATSTLLPEINRFLNHSHDPAMAPFLTLASVAQMGAFRMPATSAHPGTTLVNLEDILPLMAFTSNIQTPVYISTHDYNRMQLEYNVFHLTNSPATIMSKSVSTPEGVTRQSKRAIQSGGGTLSSPEVVYYVNGNTVSAVWRKKRVTVFSGLGDAIQKWLDEDTSSFNKIVTFMASLMPTPTPSPEHPSEETTGPANETVPDTTQEHQPQDKNTSTTQTGSETPDDQPSNSQQQDAETTDGQEPDDSLEGSKTATSQPNPQDETPKERGVGDPEKTDTDGGDDAQPSPAPADGSEQFSPVDDSEQSSPVDDSQKSSFIDVPKTDNSPTIPGSSTPPLEADTADKSNM